MVANVGLVTNDFIKFFKDKIPQTRPVLSFQDIPSFDLLIFTGGEDISPIWYGREEVTTTRGINVQRDAKEIASLSLALKYPSIKILGICRGHQLINAYLGGKLIEDLSEVVDNHGSYHALEITDSDSIVANYFNLVNSLHHQAVVEPGEGQRITSKVGEIIESTESERILTIQFHPEFMAGFDKFWEYVTNDWLK